ncbi:MAG: FixH family protein [Bacteroidota bacterium]
MTRRLLVALGLLALAGCVPDGVADFDFQALQPPAPPEELTGFALVGTAEVGGLSVELFADRGGLHVGYNRLRVRLAEGGVAVTEARIALAAAPAAGLAAGTALPAAAPPTRADADGFFEGSAFVLTPDTTARTFILTAAVETLDGAGGTATFEAEARPDIWMQQRGDLLVSWVQPSRPVVGENTFEVAAHRWTGEAFEAVAGASADLYPYMDMGGGDGHSTPYDDFASEGSRYRWTVDFIMAGGWEMTVTLAPTGGGEEPFRFVGYTVYEP